MFFAAVAGNLRVVRLLICNKASANLQDHKGWTPLIKAVQHGHLMTVKGLMDMLADVNLTLDPINSLSYNFMRVDLMKVNLDVKKHL